MCVLINGNHNNHKSFLAFEDQSWQSPVLVSLWTTIMAIISTCELVDRNHGNHKYLCVLVKFNHAILNTCVYLWRAIMSITSGFNTRKDNHWHLQHLLTCERRSYEIFNTRNTCLRRVPQDTMYLKLAKHEHEKSLSDKYAILVILWSNSLNCSVRWQNFRRKLLNFDGNGKFSGCSSVPKRAIFR